MFDRAGAAACLLWIFAPAAIAAPTPRTLTLATWNLEWLMTPATHASLRRTCTVEGGIPSAVRSIPCDVARQEARGEADFARLRLYAERLDADVVALQEVDGVDAARQVFPNHDFCFTARTAVQNNGFAIRRGRGIRYRCDADLRELAVGHRHLRGGAQLTVFPGGPDELHLLSVHLKSGCANQRLTKDEESCQLLSQQIEPLIRWIDAQARAGHRFALMGDFNRQLAKEHGRARDSSGRLVKMWPEMDRGDMPGADLLNVTEGRPYIKCHISESHGAYIDHVVLGERAASNLLPDSFRRIVYAQSDAVRFKLSDHCPVAIGYRLRP
jgi:endonuclease/exonuclease/phosphatase family metal-dependent hydrolase